VGGSYRQSNAYGFNVNQTWQAGTTRAGHVSAAVTHKQWMAGLEYGNGVADSVASLPRLGLNGLEASIGYKISDSIAVSTGWQHQSYSRSSDVFFHGAPQLKMDAIYLHMKLSTSSD
jgi:spore coat protein U-like protein